MLTLAAATLIASWLSAILWGIFCCLFISTVWVIRRRGGRWWASRTMFAMVFIFLQNAYDLGAVFYFQYRAFISYKAGPEAYFTIYRIIEIPISASDDFSFACATWVVDALLTWRLYIVFVRAKWVLIVPALVIPGSIVIDCIDAWYYVSGIKGEYTNPRLLSRVDRYTIGFYACTVVLNWYLTLMIAGKIWWVQRKVSRTLQNDTNGRRGKGMYRHVVRVLVECGALYTVVMGAELICIAVKNANASTLVYHIGARTPGITLVLVVLQLNLGYTQPADTYGFSRPVDTPVVFGRRSLSRVTNATGGVHVIRSGGGKSQAITTGGNGHIEVEAIDEYGKHKSTTHGTSTTDEEKGDLGEV